MILNGILRHNVIDIVQTVSIHLHLNNSYLFT